jgi:Holliday junction resolvase
MTDRSAAGRAARDKGVRSERDVFKIFEAAGGVVLNLDGQGDHLVELSSVLYHVEVKRREQTRIEAWCHQAEQERSREIYVPTVVWRRSREPWRVAMPLDAFLDVVT